ncbi:hypothetical protein B0H14DRAFT_2713943, partial [Mycena olivaceomarginata]
MHARRTPRARPLRPRKPVTHTGSLRTHGRCTHPPSHPPRRTHARRACILLAHALTSHPSPRTPVAPTQTRRTPAPSAPTPSLCTHICRTPRVAATPVAAMFAAHAIPTRTHRRDPRCAAHRHALASSTPRPPAAPLTGRTCSRASGDGEPGPFRFWLWEERV